MEEEEAAASSPSPQDMALTPTVPLRPYVPAVRARPPLVPPPPPTTPLPPYIGKRALTSPEERRPVDVVRMCRPATPPRPSVAAPPVPPPTRPASPEAGPSQTLDQTEPQPLSSSDDEQDNGGSRPLSKATKEQLFERVHQDLELVMTTVTGASSRLNKESTTAIGARVQDALAVVATLSLRLSEAELKLAQAHLKCKSLEHEALKARSEVSVAASHHTTPPTNMVSYSSMLRLPKRAEPVAIPPTSGPVLAFYPVPDQTDTLKTAEDTKAELKRAVKPQDLDVQVDSLRKVGNAGVVVQTTTPSAAQRLRNAAPPTLRVSEPARKQPRMCLRHLDGDPTEEFLYGAIKDQNLQEDPAWSLERLKREARLFKRRGRQADSTTIIIECSPALRDTLVTKGRLYIGWQAVEVHDHIAATCCLKCQQYGHPERYCRAPEPTCARCDATGHRRPECKSATERCATCTRFSRADAGNHNTAARVCPARRYAEERAVATTNYGR